MKLNIIGLLTVGVILPAVSTQAGLTFSADLRSTINFTTAGGDAFDFTQSSGDKHVPQAHEFLLSNNSGYNYGYDGYGSFSGGPWQYGAITTSGDLQWAAVTTTGGSVSITDAHLNQFTADLNWGTIQTLNYVGGINASVAVNLSNIAYDPAGADPYLNQLKLKGGAISLSFQFSPGENLTTLAATGGKTSYNGAFTPVPEPATYIAGLGALCLFGFTALPKRKN
jgi:hypothetical protein